MDNKDKIIEEMAKGFNHQCKTSCYKDKCYTRCGTYKVCEMFYNADYRKLPKDSVALTKSELEQVKEQAVKEFATILKVKTVLTPGGWCVNIEDIDNTLKEVIGEKE